MRLLANQNQLNQKLSLDVVRGRGRAEEGARQGAEGGEEEGEVREGGGADQGSASVLSSYVVAGF